MVSQYIVWYLDDGNLSDKRTTASADEYGLSLEKTNCYLIFLRKVSKAQKKIKPLFEEYCPDIK